MRELLRGLLDLVLPPCCGACNNRVVVNSDRSKCQFNPSPW